ncbi:MAG: alanine racemase, partial [Lachnospiraceae bacterium]
MERNLENRYFRVCANISLDAIRDNIKKGKKLLAPGTKMMAVVKADAYGHGAVPVAEAIDDLVDAYAVAIPEEGVELRNAGITKPVLVLGYTAPELAELAIRHDIAMAVFQSETAEAYEQTAERLGMTAKVHIKLDTGMSRIGYLCCEESLDDIEKIAKLPNVSIEGMFTHFAKADEADKTFARGQYAKYMEFAAKLTERGIRLPVRHVCNSAGIIDIPEGDLDMVRFGI